MRQETPIGRADVRVAILPARAAYLVPAGDHRAAVVAIREASTRWAGATEPIVPVRVGGKIDAAWARVVELSNVDGLVNVHLPPALAERAAGQFGLPVVDIDDIDREGRTQFSINPCNLASSEPAGDADSWVMAPENASLWQRVAAGDYYPDRVDELSSSEMPIVRPPNTGAADEVCRAQIRGSTWLDAGVRDFAEHRTTGFALSAPMVLWVTTPRSLREYTYFWNFRALRSLRFSRAPMALLATESGVDWAQLGQYLAPHLRRPDELEPDVVLCSLNVDETALDDIATSLGLVRSTVKPYSRWTSPRPPLRTAPYTYRLNIDPRQYVSFERDYGHTVTTTVQVYRQDTHIEFDSPVRFSGPGRVLIRLESELFAALPKRPAVASMILDDATWCDDKLQTATTAMDRYRLDVRAPSQRAAAWQLLSDHCAHAELSDKGRMAVRLLELGGYDVLLDRDVRLAIDELKTRRSKELTAQLERLVAEGQQAEGIRELALRLGETQQRRFRSVQQLRSAIRKRGVERAERLCHQGWAERGLSVRCERCSVRSFVALSQTQPDGACPACQASQPYELDTSSGAAQIQYRLHGLIDRAADQGVLPHLLAIAALRREHDRTFLIPGVDVSFANDTRREVDLFGIFDGTVVAGEAKTSPVGFEESDIEADIRLSAALGADTHLMIATEPIAEETVGLASQLARDTNLGLIVVQGENVDTVVQKD